MGGDKQQPERNKSKLICQCNAVFFYSNVPHNGILNEGVHGHRRGNMHHFGAPFPLSFPDEIHHMSFSFPPPLPILSTE